jgi:hypothetical protein
MKLKKSINERIKIDFIDYWKVLKRRLFCYDENLSSIGVKKNNIDLIEF